MKKSFAIILSAVIILALAASCGTPERPLTVAELLDLGEKYLLEMNYEQALVWFLAVIEIEPRNAEAHMGAGQAYLGLGEHRQAAGYFRTAIEIDPMRVEAYLGLADAYFAMGDTEAAIAALREGYELTGDERLLRRLEELEGQESSGEGQTADSPDVGAREEDEWPAELTVLIRSEGHSEITWVMEESGNVAFYQAAQSTGVNTFNQYGLVERFEISRREEFEDFIVELLYDSTWEYSPDLRSARISTESYRTELGMAPEISEQWVEVDSSRRGWGACIILEYIYINQFPGDDRPARVDLLHQQETPAQGDPYILENPASVPGAYALLDYDGAGNVERITTYNGDGTIIGYCVFEWGLLVLGPDGTYTMR